MGLVIRPLRPAMPTGVGVRVEPQHLHWQVGRYIENLSSGPGGIGRKRVWVTEREAIQHNTILENFYDSLIPQYGFIGSSVYCLVGSGTAEPHPSQTTLSQRVAGSSTLPSGESNSITAVSNGVYDIKRVVYFQPSQVGGYTLSEWGFGPTGGSGSPVMVRELFRNDKGEAVSLVLAPSHSLKVTYVYRITLYPITTEGININVAGYMPMAGTFGITPYAVRYSLNLTSVSYANINFSLSTSETPGNAYGDLIAAEIMATGVNPLVAGVTGLGLYGVVSPNAIATGYAASNTISISNTPYSLTFSATSNRSRTTTFTVPNPSAKQTIKTAALTQGYSNTTATSTVYVLLNDTVNQDPYHQLVIGSWTLGWGG